MKEKIEAINKFLEKGILTLDTIDGYLPVIYVTEELAYTKDGRCWIITRQNINRWYLKIFS